MQTQESKPAKTSHHVNVRIDDNIPMPSIQRGSRGSKYPFDSLEVGQSFFLEDVVPNAVHSSIARYTARLGAGKAFSVRSTQEVTPESNGSKVDGLRVWRTK